MTRQTANRLATFFGTAFLIGVGLQLFALAMVLGFHDLAYSVHAKLFAISPENFDLAAYGMIGLMKTLCLVFFFTPWAALKLVAPRYID